MRITHAVYVTYIPYKKCMNNIHPNIYNITNTYTIYVHGRRPHNAQINVEHFY